MTEDRNTTAADRIAAHLANRAEYLGDIFDRGGSADTDIAEEARDEFWELPLSVETTKTIRVLLSTGGPADGLNVELDRDGNVSRVVYWFSDWFDYAETVVTDEDSPLHRYAEELAEYEAEMTR